jgi:hypothetical protein
LEEKWKNLPEDISFFYKLRMISRFYMQASKQKARVNKKMKLDTLAKLEVATANLHEDINNFQKQEEVSRLKEVIVNIETRKARGAALRSRVRWQQVGDKCTKEVFRSVRPKTTQAAITELKDRQGRCYTKRKELEKITKDFYGELYGHKDISEETLTKVMEDVPGVHVQYGFTKGLSPTVLTCPPLESATAIDSCFRFSPWEFAQIIIHWYCLQSS